MKSYDENYNYENVTVIILTFTSHTLSNISIFSISALCSQFMHGILRTLTILTFRGCYFETFSAVSWKVIGWSCLCIFQ
jgi:di/tricarboxylate transporter